MPQNKSFIAEVIQDPDNSDELLLDLDEEWCSEMGWEPGDTIIWEDKGDGAWSLTKQK